MHVISIEGTFKVEIFRWIPTNKIIGISLKTKRYFMHAIQQKNSANNQVFI